MGLAFELANLSQATLMAICATEPGPKKIEFAIPGDGDTRGAASNTKNIHVVIFDSLAGSESVVAEGGSHTGYFVRSR